MTLLRVESPSRGRGGLQLLRCFALVQRVQRVPLGVVGPQLQASHPVEMLRRCVGRVLAAVSLPAL